MSQPAVQTMWTVSLCLSALGLFLCLAVSGVLTGSIARPVQTLDEAMEKVKKGDLLSVSIPSPMMKWDVLPAALTR